MRKGATHTFDLYLTYHRCPSCGFVFENRKGYEPRFSEWVKEIECPRCQKIFEDVWKPHSGNEHENR